MTRILPRIFDNLFGWMTCLVFAGILVFSVSAINAYQEIVAQTRRVASNLTLTVERDIGRDFHLVDRSIQGIIRALRLPNLDAVPPKIRHAALFDASMNQDEFGAFVVLNQNGRAIEISGTGELPTQNFSDREYFKQHQASTLQEPWIGPVISSRLNSKSAITLSRRVPTEDGSFVGLVVGTVHLSFYQLAFNRLDLGTGGSITLVHDDGTIILRDPEMPLGFEMTPEMKQTYQVTTKEPCGFGIALGPDGVYRYYAFHRVSDLPMFIVVGLSVSEMLTPWLQKFAAIGLLTALFCATALRLTRALDIELRRRRDAEECLVSFNRELEGRVVREIAAREDAQHRLMAGQRLEALGKLAGGVAHDFNNVLQTVSSANSLLAEYAGARQQRLTGMIADAAERGASVARRLLVFARQSDLRVELASANSLIQNLKELLTHTLGDGIEIRVEAEAELPSVLIDRLQLETVLINLAINARDAMMPVGGILTIHMRQGADERQPSSRDTGICIIVSDTGCGMPAAVLTRATEPFFTTKPVGEGTGLGLAMASGFAEQSGGSLTITSKQGVGTTITIWLPAADADAELGVLHVENPSFLEGSNLARILLVDDDAVVRELLAEQLEGFGYQVMQAADGVSALAMAASSPDVLVTDFSMPGMDGITLIKKLYEIHPHVPAILVTGYAGDFMSLARTGPNQGNFTLLEKPLKTSQLVRCVSALLLENRGEAGSDESNAA